MEKVNHAYFLLKYPPLLLLPRTAFIAATFSNMLQTDILNGTMKIIGI